MKAFYAKRLELYKQGLTDKNIAAIEGVTPQAIGWWRGHHRLKANHDSETYIASCPMEEALPLDQCDVMRLFLSDLVKAADACRGRKDVMGFMREWAALNSEGKRAIG
jgi:hypothetical protein